MNQQREMEEVAMAYNEILADRVRKVLVEMEVPDPDAKKMFGGVGHLLQGNMACGVHKEYLIVRVGLERYEHALAQPGTKVFDITGRPMKGWVMVVPEACEEDDALKAWVKQGVDFALTLPPK